MEKLQRGIPMKRQEIQKIGITTKSEMSRPDLIEKTIACLQKCGKTIYLSTHARKNLANTHPDIGNMRDITPPDRLDLIICLGGDGTILRTVRKLVSFDTPILGVNTGNLGFLSAIPAEDIENTCLKIWDSDYTIEERLLLSIQIVKENGSLQKYSALNEVVVSQSAIARIINLPVKVDGELLAVFRADGLIIATPTGSTAYNLAAGGPIIHPKVESMILTPVSPFSFSQKPLVIPAQKVVSLEIIDCNKEEAVITIDGQVHEPLRCGDVIEVTKHEETAKFLRLPGETYFNTLRKKLKWGESL